MLESRESPPLAAVVGTAGLFTMGFLPLVLAALIAACSSSNSPPLASGTIGVAGGVVAVPDGSPALIVPADALDGDVDFTIHDGLISIVPGYVDLGPAYLFSPVRTSFVAPAQVVVPYDPIAMPSSVDSRELRVGFRDAAGRVSGLVPLKVDPILGRITVETTGLGAFWVASPDVIAARDLFPLQDNDYYRFESDLIVTVSHTEVEPNFAPDRIVRVTFSHHGRMTGLYFEAGAAIGQLGRFDVADSQERFDSPLLWLGARDAIGVTRPAVTTLVGCRPYGDTVVAYTGLTEVTTEIAGREWVTGPLGGFDAVRVSVTTRFSTTEPVLGQDFVEFWFAPEVGPVQIRIGREATPLKLVQAVVDGQVIFGL